MENDVLKEFQNFTSKCLGYVSPGRDRVAFLEDAAKAEKAIQRALEPTKIRAKPEPARFGKNRI